MNSKPKKGSDFLKIVDYRKLRLSNITSDEFRHLFLLLFWPLFGLVFWFLERGIERDFIAVECAFDAVIPFCEYFVFPYLLWFPFLFFIHIYTLLFDIPSFKKLMYFIILSYGVTTLIFILFPTEQNLRPLIFDRDNFLVDFMKGFYEFDTNTNVCPSLHVVGSFAVLFGSWNCKGLNSALSRTIFIILTIFISISTVFLKQHSIIDIIVGLVLVFVLLPFAFILPDKIKNKKHKLKP